MSRVQLENVGKSYGAATVVDNLNLDVASGEMVALLGPSGCGKTTTLRMVAGFVNPTAGLISIDGNDVTRTPPNRRNIGLVFQNYALFPHLTVTENIAFGLKRRGVGRADIASRVNKMVEMTRLTGLGDRLPRQLSGGQQQRVAVARALVINPAVLLLDEPFSNLDAKLRTSTSLELRHVQSSLGMTSIFVTHDQHEAMSIADRVAVMNAGRVVQIGTGPQLYRQPATRFIASFLGKANFLPVKLEHVSSGKATVDCVGTKVSVPLRGGQARTGDGATLMLRPEFVALGDKSEAGLLGTVTSVTFQGSSTILYVALPNGSTLAVETSGESHERWTVGAEVSCRVNDSTAVLFDADGAAL